MPLDQLGYEELESLYRAGELDEDEYRWARGRQIERFRREGPYAHLAWPPEAPMPRPTTNGVAMPYLGRWWEDETEQL
jgi:hypothetical protein